MTLQGLCQHITEEVPNYIVAQLPSDAFHAVTNPFRAALRLAIRDSRPIAKGNVPYVEIVTGGEMTRLNDYEGNKVARIRIFWTEQDGGERNKTDCLAFSNGERVKLNQYYDSNMGGFVNDRAEFLTDEVKTLLTAQLSDSHIGSLERWMPEALDDPKSVFRYLDTHTFLINVDAKPIEKTINARPVRV